MAGNVERERQEDRREHQHLADGIRHRQAHGDALPQRSLLGGHLRGGSGGDGGPHGHDGGAGVAEPEARGGVGGDGGEGAEPHRQVGGEHLLPPSGVGDDVRAGGAADPGGRVPVRVRAQVAASTRAGRDEWA